MAAVGSVDVSVYTQTKAELWFTGPTLQAGWDKKGERKECGPRAHVILRKVTQTTSRVSGKLFTSKSPEHLEEFWCSSETVFSFFFFSFCIFVFKQKYGHESCKVAAL